MPLDRPPPFFVGNHLALDFLNTIATPQGAVIDWLVDAAADLICNYDFQLIRSCEGSACCLIFLDRTKGHARRWCSMAVCGNRAKAEAHRARTARKRGRAGHGRHVS